MLATYVRASRIGLVTCAILPSFIFGCATINPVPVDQSKPQDRLKPGLHVYESRPFILVQRPFPIRVNTILVDALISADGKQAHLLIDPKDMKLVPFLKVIAAVDNTLPSTSITIAPGETLAQGKPLVPGAGMGSATDSTGQPAPATPSATEKSQPASAPSGNKPAAKPSGTSSVDYTVDKDGTAAFLVNDLFNIIYLPDYEREYVLDASSNFGIKTLKVTVGPGGQLLAINSTVDNSQIVQPLLDIYTSVAKTAGTALTAAISPTAAAASAGAKTIAQGQSIGVAQELKPGSTVTLRLSQVSYAVPGVYPIIKPSEEARYAAVDPLILPKPAAYQIPFRTFDLIVVEALIAETSSILPVISQAQKKDGGAGVCEKQVKASQAGSVEKVTAILKTFNGKVDFKFSKDDLAEVDDAGCVKSITLTNVKNGTATFAGTDLSQLLSSLATTYPNTAFNINGQTPK